MAISAISITISRGAIFEPLRLLAHKKAKLLGTLLSCIYCTTHWVALAVLLIWGNFTSAPDFLITLFASIAISSLISGILLKLLPMNCGEMEALLKEAQKVLLEVQKKNV